MRSVGNQISIDEDVEKGWERMTETTVHFAVSLEMDDQHWQ